MVGIALEGGGAKGSYQVGAVIALLKNKIKPGMVAGTSIGAINAALIAQGDIDKMINLWLETTTDIIGIDSKLVKKIKDKNFGFDELVETYENIKDILSNKGIDTTVLFDAIKNNIDEDKVRNSKIKFGLVTLRVKGLSPLELSIDDIPEGKLAEYLLASCYLPVFSFKKIIDDNYYLDGGFYNNLPVTLLEKKGCSKIYALKIKGIGLYKKRHNINTKIIEIKPKISLGSMLIFDRESNIKHMKMGYYDALKVIKNLEGDDYYFKKRSERYYKRISKSIDDELLKKLQRKFKEKNNKDLIIKITEHIMSELDIDQYEIYNLKRQLKYIKKNNLVKESLLKEFLQSIC